MWFELGAYWGLLARKDVKLLELLARWSFHVVTSGFTQEVFSQFGS